MPAFIILTKNTETCLVRLGELEALFTPWDCHIPKTQIRRVIENLANGGCFRIEFAPHGPYLDSGWNDHFTAAFAEIWGSPWDQQDRYIHLNNYDVATSDLWVDLIGYIAVNTYGDFAKKPSRRIAMNAAYSKPHPFFSRT